MTKQFLVLFLTVLPALSQAGRNEVRRLAAQVFLNAAGTRAAFQIKEEESWLSSSQSSEKGLQRFRMHEFGISERSAHLDPGHLVAKQYVCRIQIQENLAHRKLEVVMKKCVLEIPLAHRRDDDFCCFDGGRISPLCFSDQIEADRFCFIQSR